MHHSGVIIQIRHIQSYNHSSRRSKLFIQRIIPFLVVFQSCHAFDQQILEITERHETVVSGYCSSLSSFSLPTLLALSVSFQLLLSSLADSLHSCSGTGLPTLQLPGRRTRNTGFWVEDRLAWWTYYCQLETVSPIEEVSALPWGGFYPMLVCLWGVHIEPHRNSIRRIGSWDGLFQHIQEQRIHVFQPPDRRNNSHLRFGYGDIDPT